jgi:putative oxidoreductase
MTDQTLASHGATLLRVSLGIMTLAHGLLKVFVFTIPGTVGFFASLGLPPIVAYATIAAEIVGGLALIAGLYTRTVALALVPILVGAAWAHAGNGWVFSNQGGGWEYPVFWAVVLVVQALIGSGAYALDQAVGARKSAVAAA